MTSRRDLILEHLPYARGIAFNLCWSRNLPFHFFDDCMSIAAEALIGAVDSYNESAGASLKTWITRNVRFTVTNFIKKEAWNALPVVDIEDYSNSLNLASDGTEQAICDRDLIYKILDFVRVNSLEKKGRTRKRKKELDDFLAYLMEGYLGKEVANWRGCSPPNVSLMISGLKDLIIEKFGDEFS
ncbi:MAG: sigma factor [Nanoarchaeota archaeon]